MTTRPFLPARFTSEFPGSTNLSRWTDVAIMPNPVNVAPDVNGFSVANNVEEEKKRCRKYAELKHDTTPRLS